VECTWLWRRFEVIVDGRLLAPPHDHTRTNARPDAGRMLVRVKAVFTMVPGQKLPLSAVKGWKKGTAWAANEGNCK
jgi:hypothetical protein